MAGLQQKQEEKNRLASEKSPYLLQHAGNPVDWYPWGEEAFGRAREENRPIFLSIGYSTCHWCHVMAHESFEDPGIAGLLNETFVNIKVDREERPDIDAVYMKVCQAMTGMGGWPLTIVMTPDKKPFFAASYVPKESRFGMTGLHELIPRIRRIWAAQRQDIERSADHLISALKDIAPGTGEEEPDETLLRAAYTELERQYDVVHGGFGTAPKFPSPHTLLLLLRVWNRTGDGRALKMVETTLQALHNGGVYDHVGFGIHRYSTDREWLLPHFEKMLYDQALVALAAVETFQATGDARYRRFALELFIYVQRDMRDDQSGFFAAEDADSAGEEGRFYVWTEKELREVLGEEDFAFFTRYYPVSPEGNFTAEASGVSSGDNILFCRKEMDEDAERRLEGMRQRLFDARNERIRPHRDDKTLTDWNGLMIAALATGGRVFNHDGLTRAAVDAAEFIERQLRTPDGRLLHRYRDGEAAIPGYLDDYAFMIWGLVELYETTFYPTYLRRALDLTGIVLEHFWDEEGGGGCFFTADDAEHLILREKEIYDGSVPSGNSVLLYALLRLAHLTGRVDFEERAWGIARTFAGIVAQAPAGHTMYLTGLDFALGPVREVVVAGIAGRGDTDAVLWALSSAFLPRTVVVYATPQVRGLIPYSSGMAMVDGKATAYVCESYRCVLPETDTTRLLSHLTAEIKEKR